MLTTVLVLAIASASQAPARDASALTFSAPSQVTQLKIKGEPIQLAWSDDGTQLYVQTGERTRLGTMGNARHYVLQIDGAKTKSVDAPPTWASEYYTWKSNKWAPGDHSLMIGIEDQQKRNTVTATPMGGDLARGGTSSAGTSSDEAINVAMNSQMQHIITLRLKGEQVGKYIDMQFIPGYTFGWAPESAGAMIAYVNDDDRLSVMDGQGHKKALDGTKHVMVPAWSPDGSKIAYLEKDGKKYNLFVVDVK
ncbi:MAG TPA: hypothetical protein VF159_03220 [Gemmatimonadaceae bacterium]